MEHSICVVCIQKALGHPAHYPDWKYEDGAKGVMQNIRTLDQLMDAGAIAPYITDHTGFAMKGAVFAVTMMNGNMICQYHAINSSYWNNGKGIG